jgi:hypothetical protein
MTTSIFRIAYMFVIVGLERVYHTHICANFHMNGSKGSFVISTKPKVRDAFYTAYTLSLYVFSIKVT